MNTKTTLLLLAATACLVAFIELYEKQQPGTRDARDREDHVLAFDRDDVTGIVIASNEDRLELHRTGSRWDLTAPVKDRADQNVVNEILTRCEMLRKEAVLDEKSLDGKRLADFGVTQSNLRLKLTGQRMPPELWFGKDTAVEGKTYVRLENGGSVFVTGDELRKLLVRKADDFRDHRLTEGDAAHTTRIAVRTAAGEIDLTKAGDHWGLNKPLRARAEDRKVSEFVNALLGMEIVAFAADKGANLNTYGLGEPRATVMFWTLSEEKPLVMDLGAQDEKTGAIYARLSGRDAVYLLPKRIERLFTLTPNDLRDRHLLRVDLDIVDRFTIEGADKPKLVLQRQRENWVRRDAGAATPVNTAKVLSLFKTLQTREVGAFVADIASDLPKYGLDHPQMRITFASYSTENTAETTAGEHPFLSVSFGANNGNSVYARVEDEQFIVSVDKAVLEEIDSDPVAWRPLAVFNFKPEELTALEVNYPAVGGTTARQAVSIVRGGGKWQAAPGASAGPVNSTNVQSLVNTLTTLKAVRWNTRRDHSLAAKATSVVLAFKTAAGKTFSLFLTPPVAGVPCSASLEGDSGSFVISAPDESALNLSLVTP